MKFRDEFAPSIPTFHCHILIPRQSSYKSCTKQGNVEPVSTKTGARAPASPWVLAEELMSRSGCSEKSQRAQIKQKCQSRSPTMPGNQRWILQEEGSGKMMPFVCNSNTMNQQITCKMLLMKMCIMDVHKHRLRGEGGSGCRLCCWNLKVVWFSSDGSDTSRKSWESMEVKGLSFCCRKGGFGKEWVVREWSSVW